MEIVFCWRFPATHPTDTKLSITRFRPDTEPEDAGLVEELTKLLPRAATDLTEVVDLDERTLPHRPTGRL